MTTPLAKLLWFDALANERVIINKDGALLSALRFRGPDLHSALESALIVQADQLNNLVMRFGAGWGLFSEQRRQEVCIYPETPCQHPTARLVDEERRQHFLTPGIHYANTATLTLTYTPTGSSQVVPAWKHWLYTNLPDAKEEAQVLRFEEEVRRVRGLLQECCEEVTWLEGEALLTYLHSTISWKTHTIAIPDPPCYLDTYLTDTDLERVWVLPHLGRWPKLGEQYIRCVSIKGYPQATNPGMLDVLDELPMEYRACVRFLPLDRQKAVSEAQKYGDSHYGKRTRKGGSTGRIEQIAVDYSQEASAFQAGVQHGRFSAGYLTQTVVVWDADFDKATEKAELVETTLNSAKFIAKVEKGNTMAAWDATLPGNTYANKRQPPLTSQNWAHLVPATGQSQGPRWNKHLNGPPLLYTTGRGQTPFRLDTYEDDTAHCMVIGPPGSGKSFLLALMALQWLKYPRAQIYAFDKDQSLRCATYAIGGRWYDLGQELEQMGSMGMSIDDAATRPWSMLWDLPPGDWHCFETAALMSTPTIIPQLLTPICREMEVRMLGQPVMLIFDEAWQFLGNEFFRGKMQDYLLTMRKKNGLVVFSSQNIMHITQSTIGSDIFQACPTRFYLANRHAIEPATMKLYLDLGLNERQVSIIAHLTPKKTYYYQGPHGHAVFDLGAGPIQRAFAGSSRKEDLAAMERLYQGDGAAFAGEWLRHKGLDEAAAQLVAWQAIG